MSETPKKPWRLLLRDGLDIVFLGYNPSLISWREGHYYANPGNRFYHLLYESGLTPRKLRPDEDALLLDWGMGAADLLQQPSARVDQLDPALFRQGVPRLRALVEQHRPKAVCCNGIGVFSFLFGRKPTNLGQQEDIQLGESLVFVVPSSSGLANGMTRQRQEAWKDLARWKQQISRDEA